MRKLKTRMLLFVLIGVGVIGCQKEEGDIISPVNAVAEKGTTSDKVGGGIHMRAFFWVAGHDGATPECTNKVEGTCFPVVDVNLSMAAVVDDVFNVVGSGKKPNIQATFQANYSELGRIISKELINEVVAGNLLVTKTIYNKKGERFLLFHSGGVIDKNNPFAAIPFK